MQTLSCEEEEEEEEGIEGVQGGMHREMKGSEG